MLINIVDANSQAQQIIVHGQESVVDRSGVITASLASQTLMDVNMARSGWFLQNKSQHPMYVNEIGGEADGTSVTSIVVPAGASFPPPGYAITTAKISITGTQGDEFAAREW